MGFISWIVFGLVAGLIAKAIHPGKDPGGWIITILIGIAGAFVGKFIAGLLSIDVSRNWSLMGFVFAVGGAVLLLILYSLITKKRSA